MEGVIFWTKIRGNLNVDLLKKTFILETDLNLTGPKFEAGFATKSIF
jgi:hypothetical protein